ncbi:aminoglycoside N(3)-acetyltransferase [Halostella litorea]|uniref:aminoglycoside N(3)-acetyltransferase n=1 Tax=Halostella litorea TaxID=2528831 RepID=UPI0010932F6C|nr:AAC(3) family N-acetyltransferase [Halostella litorea]
MTDETVVKRTDEPVTPGRILADLRDLGVAAGDTVIAHSSLSALGWVPGGAPGVVDALLAAVGDEGTLVMPTHSFQCSDPANWSNPPVPEAWHGTIREESPPYRPDVTPTRGVGAVPECFRDYPDTVRSRHPTLSFAANGPGAAAIVDDHAYEYPLGEGSPLARVYERDGRVLLLGTGHDANTSLHLAEHRSDHDKVETTGGGPVLVDGQRRWVEYDDVETHTDDFPAVGEAFAAAGGGTTGPVGEGTATLCSQRALVDFAADWFAENR